MAIKSTIPIAYTATQADVDAGSFNTKSGGIIIIVDGTGQDTGVRYEVGPANVAPVQIVTPSGNTGTGGSLKAWAANTAVEAGEIRRATVASGTIGIGDFISSNTARTTGATFNATEAGNWTELPDDPDLTAHISDANNPHSVTKAQVGLGSAENTTDLLKPVSTATQTALNLKANLASPTLTGTIQLDGSPILGDGANHAQRTYSDIAGAPMLMTNTTGTATSTIANTDIAARFVKPGTASAKNNASLDIVIGSHTAGINANTQVDFRLGNGATNTPDVTVLSLKGDGSVLAGANQLATTAVATTSANGLMASADKTKLDGVATGAEVNVQADYTQATTTADDFIKNKPTIPTLEGTTVPVMNGTAAVGTATTSSRSDHIHGSDTAKANTTDLTDGSISAYFDSIRTDGVINLTASTDINTLTVNGAFNVNTPTNAPIAGGWWYVEHYCHRNTTIIDTNYAFQRAVKLETTANTWYHRTRVNGTWTAWEEIATMTDINLKQNTLPVGQATLVAGTVTVSLASVVATSRIFLTRANGTGVVTGVLRVGTITAGTSFVITSSDNTDTGLINYLVV